MNLSQELQNYLKIRRNLGYILITDERILKQFVLFLETNNQPYITSDLFLQWKKVFGNANQSTWANRLCTIRLFASWLYTLNTNHEIPPKSLILNTYRRKKPYIYSDYEILSIIKAASLLHSSNGFREITYPAFFGLVSVTGLRISEAISLNNKDIDLEDGIITLHYGKNGKERILPVTDCTKTYLKEYSRKRDRLLGHIPKAFFISNKGIRLTDCAVRYNFAVIGKMIGLRAEQHYHKHGVGPRVHDLRHTFAVNVIIKWYKEGKDVNKEMLKLITYLGHVKVANTYWYIEAVPELLSLASHYAENNIEKEVEL